MKKLSQYFPLTCAVETNLVEVPPAGLVADVLVHQIRTQLIQANGVGERFTVEEREERRLFGTKYGP